MANGKIALTDHASARKPLAVMLCHQRGFPSCPRKREVHLLLIRSRGGPRCPAPGATKRGCAKRGRDGRRGRTEARETVGLPVQHYGGHDAVLLIFGWPGHSQRRAGEGLESGSAAMAGRVASRAGQIGRTSLVAFPPARFGPLGPESPERCEPDHRHRMTIGFVPDSPGRDPPPARGDAALPP